MKRFLADAILICVLVSIGSYIVHKEDATSQEDVQYQMDHFEDRIAQNKHLDVNKQSAALNDIEDNKAGMLAKKSSAFVVDAIKGTVEVFSGIFDGVMK